MEEHTNGADDEQNNGADDKQNKGTNKDEFNLWFLLNYLERLAAKRLGRMKCLTPRVCGHDVALDLIYTKNFRILGDRVWLNFPRAILQMAVLHTELGHQVSKQKTKCPTCGPRMLPIVEERGSDDFEHGPSAPCPVDPATPETLLKEIEVIEKVRACIPNERQRAAFEAYVLDGLSHKEIAALLGERPATVRKWYSRNLALLKERFPDVESLWAT